MGKKKQGCILSWLLGAGACTPSHGAGEVAAPPTDCGDGGVFSFVFFFGQWVRNRKCWFWEHGLLLAE